MNKTHFDGTDDIFDSREVIDRIEELIAEFEEATGDDPADYALLSEDDWAHGLGEDGVAELVALLALQEEAERELPDWAYGETFIREDYFTDYAMELLEDCGYLPADLPDWIVIDRDATAENMKADYSEFEFRGNTYLARH